MTRRTAGALVALVLSLVMAQSPATATGAAKAGRSQAASTGRWAAVVRGVASTMTSGTLTLPFTWTSGTRNQTTYQPLDLANVGTLNTSGAVISIPRGTTATNWSTTGTPTAVITLRMCNDGTWTVSGTGKTTATCSSGSVTNVPTSVGPTSYTCSNLSTACAFIAAKALSPGQEQSLVIGMTSGRAGTYTITISAAVDRSRVRAAIARHA